MSIEYFRFVVVGWDSLALVTFLFAPYRLALIADYLLCVWIVF
jgi:hypothetical protein